MFALPLTLLAMLRPITISTLLCVVTSASTIGQNVAVQRNTELTHAIEIRRVVTLRSTAEMPISRSDYLPHIGHYFFHSSLYDPGRIHIFDDTGAPVKAIGRLGSGPGEFRGPLALYQMPGDSVLVVDTRNARFTVISPSLQVTRSFTARFFPRSVLWLPERKFVAAAQLNTPERIGHPYHLVTENHEIVSSFGYDGRPVLPSKRFELERHIAPSLNPNQFWSAARWRYQIELWDVSGKRVRYLAGKPEWFVNEHHGITPKPDGPPPPTLLGAIHQDRSGNLWVIYNVAAENWKAAFNSEREGPHGPEPAVDRLYDSVIEVIEPRTGKVFARARSDKFVRGASGDLLFGEVTDSNGVERLEVWSHRLIPRTPTRR